MKNRYIILLLVAVFIFFSGCASVQKRELSSFEKTNTECYDRKTQPYTFVVDAHMHSRPFGGRAVPFDKLNEYFYENGVLFANMFGIGQLLPINSPCKYYAQCPGTPVLPSMKSDFANASNYLDYRPQKIHVVLAMTFMDLSKPDNIVDMIHLYDKEYPDMFKWAGEVNLVKQAIFRNHHQPITKQQIDGWVDFMQLLQERNIPLTFHADLGSDKEPTKYEDLMEYILIKYPNNKIIWAHMGLSKELAHMNVKEHIKIMKYFLDNYPNLMLDTSWRVLYDSYFSDPKIRDEYVAFFNQYSTRILPGTDFVAAREKNFDVYKKELEITSRIFKYVNDEAFRNIVLGENYFRLMGLEKYRAPQICK